VVPCVPLDLDIHDIHIAAASFANSQWSEERNAVCKKQPTG